MTEQTLHNGCGCLKGVDKKSYEKIRVNSDCELVKKNIKNLVKERNRRKAVKNQPAKEIDKTVSRLQFVSAIFQSLKT